MTKTRLNVGVIGAGMIGKVHAEHLAFRIPETETCLHRRYQSTAVQELAEKLRVSKAVKDYHELLNDPNVDAVAICSSTNTHAQIICEAALAGKHIFCEKPISYDLKKIDEALATVKKTGVKLQIGFNRRFDPNFARVRKAMVDGTIGDTSFIPYYQQGSRTSHRGILQNIRWNIHGYDDP